MELYGECRFCFKSIDGRAQICPYCQSEKPQKFDGLSPEEQAAVHKKWREDRDKQKEREEEEVERAKRLEESLPMWFRKLPPWARDNLFAIVIVPPISFMMWMWLFD